MSVFQLLFGLFCLVTLLAGSSSSLAIQKHDQFLVDFAGAADLVGKLPLVDFDVPFRHYSGYLDSIEEIKLHYWFFESQNSPKTDPVVLWLNGGPGCSSLYGAFTENGPLRAHRNGTFSLNPFSWNRNASLLYLESPVLVGFSFFNKTGVKPPINNDARTAAQNLASLKSFFTVKFPHLQKNPFYITGESYAGRYIPQLAVKLLKEKFPQNFKGVAIGNGYLNPRESADGLYGETHGIANYLTNVYNILADCNDLLDGDDDSGVCSGVGTLTRWLNRKEVQQAIHVYGSLPLHWEFINDHLPYDGGDDSMEREVKEMVKQGLRVVIYNGDLDTVCNFIGDQRFAEKLGFAEDSPALISQCHPLEEGKEKKDKVRNLLPFAPKRGTPQRSPDSCTWIVDRDPENSKPSSDVIVGGLGRTFHSGSLVFLTVRGAGHMVPFDKPAAAFTMFNGILLQLKRQ